jgi:IS1 family transposase
MNTLDTAKRVAIVRALVEGNSIRSTCRMTGVSKNTVVKLIVDLGTACAAFHDETVRNVQSRRIQCDEIWSYVYSKQKNVPEDHLGEFGFGDVWTWTALDADSKLIVSWLCGWRDAATASEFMTDVASRLANRVQLTTDGHKAYLQAVEDAFGGDVDYAMLVKLYGEAREAEGRYSPAECQGCKRTSISGRPDKEHVSTSYVERVNLTLRMTSRRFTRLTNGFSKKVENLMHQVAINFCFYNFCRIHQTLRSTPAMRAGVADHLWTVEELVNLIPPVKYNTRPKKTPGGLN